MNRLDRRFAAPLLAALLLGVWAAPATAQAVNIMTTVAGGGVGGGIGDGGPATMAQLAAPSGLALDTAGNLFIAEFNGHRVRRVDAVTGIITTFAGTGTAGYSGDTGQATSAQLMNPRGLAVDIGGNLYIADMSNHRVRKVAAGSRIITTIAGTGTAGSKGDGGTATLAQLNYPSAVAVDAFGGVYIADRENHRIRKVSAGLLTTVAGSGTAGFSGDGGAATAAELDMPWGIAVDVSANLYIADTGNQRIRRVSALSDRISTVAGSGTAGYSGDGGAATQAQLYNPLGVCLDSTGTIYVADQTNHRIRKVSRSIWTFAGTGTGGFSGDDGPALAAQMFYPKDVAQNSDGILYIADAENGRVRKVETRRAARGDFDADLKSDILWRHGIQGEVWMWPMDGITRLSETWVRTIPDTAWVIAGIGDQTGDGQADILWRNTANGQIYFWPMNGTTPLGEIYVGTVSPAYAISSTGDYNGDGKSDILWRNGSNGEVWIWLMDGPTPTSQVRVDTVAPQYQVKASGDLDGDTMADIVWHNTATGEVWVWLMNGTTRLSQTWVATVPDTNYQIRGAADHTGDGKVEIEWWHVTRGEVWFWTMAGAELTAETWVATVPDTSYRIAGNGDYDGNGKADFVWHNITSGDVWMWLMDGTTKLSETWIATVPDTGYRIVR